jgi:hypothetical protein
MRAFPFQLGHIVSPQRERSPTISGYAFFDEVTLDFPKLQRRKEETVCWFKLGNVIVICRRRLQSLVMLAGPLPSPFGLQAHAPWSSRSHQRFSLLVSPFLFTFGSCHDLTTVVTDLLR